MRCAACDAENDTAAEACFTCGRAFDVLTRGLVLSGRYEVRRPLGSGGMGRVYEAHDRVLDESVAIKVLRTEVTGDPVIAQRFLSEIKLARKVSHHNVCRIHEYNEDAGVAFISMEFIAGRSLKALLQAGRPDWTQAFDLALQVAEGLAAIHAHGIVHRDFKSGNIMVDDLGVAKIVDFGIAKQVGAGTTGLSGGGHVFGTPEYMSPEQVDGQKVDMRSDLYALGCVIYEIFTRRPPFQGETPYATLLMHLRDPPPLEAEPHGLPLPLVGLLSRVLAKDPAARPASVAELILVLRQARQLTLGEAPGEGKATTLKLAATADASAFPAPDTRPHAGAGRSPSPGGSFNTVTLLRLLKGIGTSPRSPGQRQRRGVWALVATAAAALAVAFVLTTGPLSKTADPPPPTLATPSPGPAVTLVAVSPPTLAPVLEASRAPAPAPAPTPAGRPNRPPASSRPADGPPSLPAPAPLSEPSLAPPEPTLAVESRSPSTTAPVGGTLALIVVPDAEVILDERPLGTMGRRDIPLSAGPHVLRVLHSDYEPLPRRFTIRAGETLTLLLDLQEKAIRRPSPR